MGRVRQWYDVEIGVKGRKYRILTNDIDRAVKATETWMEQDRMRERRLDANPSPKRSG